MNPRAVPAQKEKTNNVASKCTCALFVFFIMLLNLLTLMSKEEEEEKRGGGGGTKNPWHWSITGIQNPVDSIISFSWIPAQN